MSAVAGAGGANIERDPQQRRFNLGRRLSEAQRDVREKEDAWKASLELRRELVVQGVDVEGMTTGEVARALGLSQSRVMAILGQGVAA